MRKAIKIGIAGAGIAALCWLAPPAARAADVTVGADLNTSYVWRGLTFNDSFVLQPSADIALPANFGFNVWGNFDLDDYPQGGIESGDFSEVDLTLSYAIPEEWERVDLGIGLIEYLFPGGGSGTREVYGDITVSLVEGLSAAVFFTYDFDEVEDYYGNVSLSYGYAVTEELSIDLTGLVGFAGKDFAAFYNGGTSSGFNEYDISLSLAYALNDATELGAFIAHTDKLDEDVLPADTVDVDFYGGISAYYGF
jgi:hypothetical protein